MKPVTLKIDTNPLATGVQQYLKEQLPQLAPIIADWDTRWGDYFSSSIQVRLRFDELRFGSRDEDEVRELKRLWVKGKMRNLLEAGADIINLGWHKEDGAVRFELGFGKVESPYSSPRWAIMIVLDELIHWSEMYDMLFVKNRVKRDLPDEYKMLEDMLELKEGEQE